MRTHARTIVAVVRNRALQQRVAALLLVALLVGLAAATSPAAAQVQPPFRTPPGDGRITMALTGDAVITRRLSPLAEPAFLQLMEVIRGADVAFTNLETLLHDYEPAPAAQSGGTWLRAEPLMARELAWAGFDLVSLANDHSGDYGDEGMRLTRRYVEQAGMITAGTGEDLREAREARFLETHNGRVALIAAASTFTPHSRAGAPRGGVRGRPGISPLRIGSLGPRMIEPARLEALRTTLRDIGQTVPASGEPLTAFGVRLAPGSEMAQRGTPNATDVREIGAVVRNAKGLSDQVILSIHAHNQGAFLQTFARAMIDSGASVVVGHGPHSLRGIELWNGKPIFYSLGDFIYQEETVQRLPFDSFNAHGLDAAATVADYLAARGSRETSDYRSVVAVPVFEGERLVSLELHPITLGAGEAPHARGRPLLAPAALGREIIADIAARSAVLGTNITWDESRGIGVVQVGG